MNATWSATTSSWEQEVIFVSKPGTLFGSYTRKDARSRRKDAAGHPITPSRGRDDDPAANVATTPNKAVEREPPTSLESIQMFYCILN